MNTRPRRQAARRIAHAEESNSQTVDDDEDFSPRRSRRVRRPTQTHREAHRSQSETNRNKPQPLPPQVAALLPSISPAQLHRMSSALCVRQQLLELRLRRSSKRHERLVRQHDLLCQTLLDTQQRLLQHVEAVEVLAKVVSPVSALPATEAAEDDPRDIATEATMMVRDFIERSAPLLGREFAMNAASARNRRARIKSSHPEDSRSRGPTEMTKPRTQDTATFADFNKAISESRSSGSSSRQQHQHQQPVREKGSRKRSRAASPNDDDDDDGDDDDDDDWGSRNPSRRRRPLGKRASAAKKPRRSESRLRLSPTDDAEHILPALSRTESRGLSDDGPLLGVGLSLMDEEPGGWGMTVRDRFDPEHALPRPGTEDVSGFGSLFSPYSKREPSRDGPRGHSRSSIEHALPLDPVGREDEDARSPNLFGSAAEERESPLPSQHHSHRRGGRGRRGGSGGNGRHAYATDSSASGGPPSSTASRWHHENYNHHQRPQPSTGAAMRGPFSPMHHAAMTPVLHAGYMMQSGSPAMAPVQTVPGPTGVAYALMQVSSSAGSHPTGPMTAVPVMRRMPQGGQQQQQPPMFMHGVPYAHRPSGGVDPQQRHFIRRSKEASMPIVSPHAWGSGDSSYASNFFAAAASGLSSASEPYASRHEPHDVLSGDHDDDNGIQEEVSRFSVGEFNWYQSSQGGEESRRHTQRSDNRSGSPSPRE